MHSAGRWSTILLSLVIAACASSPDTGREVSQAANDDGGDAPVVITATVVSGAAQSQDHMSMAAYRSEYPFPLDAHRQLSLLRVAERQLRVQATQGVSARISYFTNGETLPGTDELWYADGWRVREIRSDRRSVIVADTACTEASAGKWRCDPMDALESVLPTPTGQVLQQVVRETVPCGEQSCIRLVFDQPAYLVYSMFHNKTILDSPYGTDPDIEEQDFKVRDPQISRTRFEYLLRSSDLLPLEAGFEKTADGKVIESNRLVLDLDTTVAPIELPAAAQILPPGTVDPVEAKRLKELVRAAEKAGY